MDEQNPDTKPTVSVLFTQVRNPVTQELYGVIGVYRLENEKQARFVMRNSETNKVVFCDPPAVFMDDPQMLQELKKTLSADNIVLQIPSVLMIAKTADQDKPHHLN